MKLGDEMCASGERLQDIERLLDIPKRLFDPDTLPDRRTCTVPVFPHKIVISG